MPEQQNTEYKSSWHEEYLDWICGIANAQGSKIYVGKDNIKLLLGTKYKFVLNTILY